MATERNILACLITVVLAIGFAAGQPAGATKERNISAKARAYLEHALDVMQQNALHRETIDWGKLRSEALDHAAAAEIPVDTYEAIRWALHQVNRHSFLQLSPELEKQEADRKSRTGAEFKPTITTATQHEHASIFLRRDKPEAHVLEHAGAKIAYVVVPHFMPRDDSDGVQFETMLQHLIAQLDAARPRGWIIDLRGNAGGNMWPMLAGLGPLLGEGVAGAFNNSDGKKSNWFYRDGTAGMEGTEPWSYPKVDGVPYRIADNLPVAVLIDIGTASSGEAVAVAFRGKPNTRFFGEHTQGVSTDNTNFLLSDGANMILTIGVYVDRSGKEYEDGIEPDVKIASPKDSQPPDADNAINEAEQWLGSLVGRNR